MDQTSLNAIIQTLTSGGETVAPEDFVAKVCMPACAPAGVPARTSQQVEKFNKLLAHLHDHDDKATARVIGAHVSQQVPLPVVEITLPRNFGKLVIRDNFYDTKISFELNVALPEDTFGRIGYFNKQWRVKDVYCEGFPQERVHGLFDENQSTFTVETGPLGALMAENLLVQVMQVLKTLPPPAPVREPIESTVITKTTQVQKAGKGFRL